MLVSVATDALSLRPRRTRQAIFHRESLRGTGHTMDQDVLYISTEANGDVTIVRLRGELDSMNVTDLNAAFSSLLHAKDQLFVLDLAGLDFIDSAGLGSLVAIWERTIEQGCFLALGEVSPRVNEVLQVTGLNGVLQPHGSVDAASAAVRAMVSAFPRK
jgi:anti-anti-sigma factor